MTVNWPSWNGLTSWLWSPAQVAAPPQTLLDLQPLRRAKPLQRDQFKKSYSTEPDTWNLPPVTLSSWKDRVVNYAARWVPGTQGYLGGFVGQRLNLAVQSAQKELAAGVCEEWGANRGARVDQYARVSQMSVGGKWCGFFVGFNYHQAGFKHVPQLASMLKARNFFLYYHWNSGKDTSSLARHKLQGSTRQYFMLEESPSRAWIKQNQKQFPHFDVHANTFNYRNLPIKPGDVVLFERQNSSQVTHVAMVESYDPGSGRLVTIEGNVSNKVVRKSYDLTNPSVRRDISGFGRPAAGDFTA